MTAILVEPPAPPASSSNPVETLTRKLESHRTSFSPRMLAVIGDILKNADWSNSRYEPVLVVDGQVYTGEDTKYGFPVGQLDATFAREFERFGFTDVEQTAWDHLYKTWKS